MVLNLSGDVNNEMLTSLITGINGLKEGDKLHMYFNCPMGGDSDITEAILDIINNNKEIIKISFFGELFSAGMVLFLFAECEKHVLKDTRGMYHFSWQEMSINETGKPSGEYDMFSIKEMKKSKERTIERLRATKLTDKEVAVIKKGKDAYFSYERMKELI